MAQVLVVYAMASDAEQRKPEGQAVDKDKEDLQDDDRVDEAGEELARGDSMLFHKLREVVKTRRWRASNRG